MNFLSHYYIDQQTKDSYYAFGLVFPDLIRNAYHGKMIYPGNLKLINSLSPAAESIRKGWERHLLVDQIFHTSTFFKKECHYLFELFYPVVNQTQVRASFLGHVALELMLDHILILEQKVNVTNFYKHLAAVDMDMVTLFLQECDVNNPEKYSIFHHNFLKQAYLYDYNSIKGIVYALEQICKRLWPDALQSPKHQPNLWVEILENYKVELHDKWDVFFKSTFHLS